MEPNLELNSGKKRGQREKDTGRSFDSNWPIERDHLNVRRGGERENGKKKTGKSRSKNRPGVARGVVSFFVFRGASVGDRGGVQGGGPDG